MPRIARLVIPGLPHHITQRGNYRQKVFYRDEDRLLYLELLREFGSLLRKCRPPFVDTFPPLSPLLGSVAVFGLWLTASYKAPRWRWWASTAVAGILLASHVYGYDAALLLLPIWLTLFENTWKPGRIAATLVSTPIPYLMTLADKPYSVAGAAGLALFLVVLAGHRFAEAVQIVAEGNGK